MEYANHATVEQEPEKTLKALVKDSKRGNVLTLDKRLIQYIPNTHKSPLGITDINHPIKTPRPFLTQHSAQNIGVMQSTIRRPRTMKLMLYFLQHL